MFPATLAFTVVMAASPTGSPISPAHSLQLGPSQDTSAAPSRSACVGDRSLCYDQGSGRIVYKPARALMPGIPGMQRENISVKRDRIVLRYSF